MSVLTDISISSKEWWLAEDFPEEIIPTPTHDSKKHSVRPGMSQLNLSARNCQLSSTPVSSGGGIIKRVRSMPRGFDGYEVKATCIDAFMKSDGERKKKLENEHAKRCVGDEFFIKKKTKTTQTKETPKPPSHLTAAQHCTMSFASDKVFGGYSSSILHDGEDSTLNTHSELSLDSLSVASIEKANEELSNGVYEQYFGANAVLDLHSKYRKIRDDREDNTAGTEVPNELSTPRSLYLREVVKGNLLPLPLVLRKETHPLGLHLGHRGLGDARLAPVIKIVEKLPALRTIDFSDNRLTDAALKPLTEKLQQLKHLTYLDLSFNKIDDSSTAIMEYLQDESCQLRTLLLNGADVDDGECANLAEAISHNKSIRTLGLAKNLIGKSELLNIVYPGFVRGGERLGDMLKVNRTLTKLDLSWNSIRLDSAIAVAKSLEVNSTLQTLLLGYNGFGDIPSQILGQSLKTNKSLTELDVECNETLLMTPPPPPLASI